MANLYELKFENYGVCLNIEINSIEKNAFLCEQIDENQGFETNILKIREITLDDTKNNTTAAELDIGSYVEVYTLIMLNDQLNNIHGWQPAKLKELKGDFCLVDLYINGALQSKIVEKRFVRNAIHDEEYKIISYDHLKFYKMDFLDMIDEKIQMNESNDKNNNNLTINANNHSILDKKKISEKFIQDLKQIVNPYFVFVNLNQNSNYLVMHEDIDEELVSLLLETANEHYKEVFQREKLVSEYIRKNTPNIKKEKAAANTIRNTPNNLERASISANYLYEKSFTLGKIIYEIIEPKIEFYKNNFDLLFEIENVKEELLVKVYSNSLQLLIDCVTDVFIVERNLEFKANRKNPFFDIKTEESLCFKKLAEDYKILFYEIIPIDETAIRIKILGNENNIKMLKNSADDYLNNNELTSIDRLE